MSFGDVALASVQVLGNYLQDWAQAGGGGSRAVVSVCMGCGGRRRAICRKHHHQLVSRSFRGPQVSLGAFPNMIGRAACSRGKTWRIKAVNAIVAATVGGLNSLNREH
ncbi:hypothetical protein F2981_02490 [Sinorhizobium meliloti]|nr:hypothetical protein [Sinorhizobium meliloti]